MYSGWLVNRPGDIERLIRRHWTAWLSGYNLHCTAAPEAISTGRKRCRRALMEGNGLERSSRIRQDRPREGLDWCDNHKVIIHGCNNYWARQTVTFLVVSRNSRTCQSASLLSTGWLAVHAVSQAGVLDVRACLHFRNWMGRKKVGTGHWAIWRMKVYRTALNTFALPLCSDRGAAFNILVIMKFGEIVDI